MLQPGWCRFMVHEWNFHVVPGEMSFCGRGTLSASVSGCA
jgi:hypothetical protein